MLASKEPRVRRACAPTEDHLRTPTCDLKGRYKYQVLALATKFFASHLRHSTMAPTELFKEKLLPFEDDNVT